MELVTNKPKLSTPTKMFKAQEETLEFIDWWEKRVFGPKLTNAQFETIRRKMWKINGLT